MLSKISAVPNWHRYLYALLASLLVVLCAIQTGDIPLLPALPASWTWAPLVLVLLIAFLKDFLPRVQLPTGPGAPPIESPPRTNDPPVYRDAVPMKPPLAKR